MNITFETYDKIVERGKEYAYDMIQIDKLDDFERMLNEEYGIEFLICLMEYGEFKTVKEQEVKKHINEILNKNLNFVDEENLEKEG